MNDDATLSEMDHVPISMVGHRQIYARRITVTGGQIFRFLRDWERGAGRFWISSSVQMILKSTFCLSNSLTSIAFESNSHLFHIEAEAFPWSSLTSIHLPASVEMISEGCFANCPSLQSITFESNSKLSGMGPRTFYASALSSIHLPASLEMIPPLCFSKCDKLRSVGFESNSQ
jgi:hypothetical protein